MKVMKKSRRKLALVPEGHTVALPSSVVVTFIAGLTVQQSVSCSLVELLERQISPEGP